ncbi:relaxin-3-like [Athene cunicularia]|uniref:relaxin-3-like n=1 Tax=Athene cunicularia TaxID=194338 RepID=UPI000EF652DC|nr:relaxin-3-like [Athene cunicularia]
MWRVSSLPARRTNQPAIRGPLSKFPGKNSEKDISNILLLLKTGSNIGHGHQNSARTASNKLLGNVKLQSILSPEVEQLQRSSPFLGWEMYKDFYSLNDYNEYVPVADDFKELVQQVEEAVSSPADRGGTGIADHMGSNSYLWARYPRRKRESLGLAGMCCKWGCTKAEISTICRV